MRRKKIAIATVRMTPKVKEQLRQRAQDANMTLTDYLCICGLGREIVRVDGLDDIESPRPQPRPTHYVGKYREDYRPA